MTATKGRNKEKIKMKLDYMTQLNPNPIKLSVGTVRKPKLRDIADLTFSQFEFYEMFLRMSPELFYTKIKGDGKAYWNSLTDKERENMTLYEVVLNEQSLQKIYMQILNFFLVETVVFYDDLFVLIDAKNEISSDDICGIINKEIFLQVLNVIQQICCIAEKEDEVDESKFKNKLARKLYNKMKKAAQKESEERKADINLTLPNIISAVSNKHPTLNPINIWDLTIFQLLDSFSRLQVNSIYNIDSTRVSVWGDEKKTFNAALWYKNEYDNK